MAAEVDRGHLLLFGVVCFLALQCTSAVKITVQVQFLRFDNPRGYAHGKLDKTTSVCCDLKNEEGLNSSLQVYGPVCNTAYNYSNTNFTSHGNSSGHGNYRSFNEIRDSDLQCSTDDTCDTFFSVCADLVVQYPYGDCYQWINTSMNELHGVLWNQTSFDYTNTSAYGMYDMPVINITREFREWAWQTFICMDNMTRPWLRLHVKALDFDGADDPDEIVDHFQVWRPFGTTKNWFTYQTDEEFSFTSSFSNLTVAVKVWVEDPFIQQPGYQNGSYYNGSYVYYDDSHKEFFVDNCSVCYYNFTAESCMLRPEDPCRSNPCLHGGTCLWHTDNDTFTCDCTRNLTLSQYEGPYCENWIDRCKKNPCPSGNICVDGVFPGLVCICLPGFTGLSCSINIDDCRFDSCQNGGVCVDEVDGYHCDCLSGYSGRNCETALAVCNQVTCENGGYRVFENQQAECRCPLGTEGPYCHKRKAALPLTKAPDTNSSTYFVVPSPRPGMTINCILSTVCEIPLFFSPSPRQETSIHVIMGDATTDMSVNVTGPVADSITGLHNVMTSLLRVMPMTAENQSVCVQIKTATTSVNETDDVCYHVVATQEEKTDSHSQQSLPGSSPPATFADGTPPNGSSIVCVLNHPCHLIVYSHENSHQICEQIRPMSLGVFLFDTKRSGNGACATDVLLDPTLATGFSSEPSEVCLRAENSGEVRCFTLNISKTDPCEIPDPCENEGLCLPDSNGGHTCVCLKGFTGDRCQSAENGCASMPCQNGGTCIDGNNNYTCVCPYGFTGANCEATVTTTETTTEAGAITTQTTAIKHEPSTAATQVPPGAWSSSPPLGPPATSTTARATQHTTTTALKPKQQTTEAAPITTSSPVTPVPSVTTTRNNVSPTPAATRRPNTTPTPSGRAGRFINTQTDNSDSNWELYVLAGSTLSALAVLGILSLIGLAIYCCCPPSTWAKRRQKEEEDKEKQPREKILRHFNRGTYHDGRPKRVRHAFV